MYPHQAERLTGILDRGGLDVLLATSPANVAYITGYQASSASLWRRREFGIFTRAGTAFVGNQHDVMDEGVEVDHVVGLAQSGQAGDDASTWGTRGPGEAIVAALARLGVRSGKVGIDESHLTYGEWQHLVERLSPFEVGPGAAQLAQARRVKGPYEIECLGRALHIAEEALDVVIQTVDRGMTEREAADLITTEIVKREGWPHPPVVAMGGRTAMLAPRPTAYALRSGQFVRFEVGCAYKGYCSRVARTAVLGPPAPPSEEIYRGVQARLEAIIDAVGLDTAVGNVSDAARQAARSHSPDAARDFVGCGIGLEVREAPDLATATETSLELGEVLVIELSHREVGSFGMSVQDTVLVTTAGARVLNRSHHGLVVLE